MAVQVPLASAFFATAVERSGSAFHSYRSAGPTEQVLELNTLSNKTYTSGPHPEGKSRYARSCQLFSTVKFTDVALERAKLHNKHPSLDKWSKKTEKQTTPIDMDQVLMDDFEVREYSQKQARIRAWELNQELYPSCKSLDEEQNTFFNYGISKKKTTPGPKRSFIVDSGASFHFISKKHMTSDERRTIRKSSLPVSISTANGIVSASQIADVWVHELKRKIVCYLLKDVPPLISLGKLCIEKYPGRDSVVQGVIKGCTGVLQGDKEDPNMLML